MQKKDMIKSFQKMCNIVKKDYHLDSQKSFVDNLRTQNLCRTTTRIRLLGTKLFNGQMKFEHNFHLVLKKLYIF